MGLIRPVKKTPGEQRIAIAMACGWHSFRLVPNNEPHYLNKDGALLWGMPSGAKETSLPTDLVPDYLNDLNAMHEAEKTMDNDKLWFMSARLAEIVPADIPIAHATAAERAQAFLESYDKFLGED